MTRAEHAWVRALQLLLGGLAVGVLANLVASIVQNAVTGGGRLALVGYVIAALLVLLALPYLWDVLRLRRKTSSGDAGLIALADQAEQQVIALSSDAGGMAASEWFRANEAALQDAVHGEGKPVAPDRLDDIARICDALEVWYVRERRAADLLALADRQSALADHTGRRDLEEIAAARAGTANRMLGDLDEATNCLGSSGSIAPRGRTAAALKGRRQVEWALLHLARADRLERGPDRDDEVDTARDRLDEAANLLPRADVDADLAVRIDLGLARLYRHADDGTAEAGAVTEALEHLELAAARAHQAHNAALQAHARELCGVAAWMQGNPWQADAWWHEARRLYADIDDRQGHGRCLQHLGSAALVRGDAATAVRLLEESIWLRDGAGELAARYLAEARHRLRPDQQPAATRSTEPRPTLGASFRRFFRWLFRRGTQVDGADPG